MFLLVGLILVGLGLFLFRRWGIGTSDKVEILNSTSDVLPQENKVVVEVSGAVVKPGVYRLSEASRIEDLLIAAGGISGDADRDWVEKYINRAAKLSDGQKLYIFRTGEQSGSEGGAQDVLGDGQTTTININSASLQQLDSLPGIGPVYGQSIIEHRPYSSVDELVSKGALKQGVYTKIKDLVTVY